MENEPPLSSPRPRDKLITPMSRSSPLKRNRTRPPVLTPSRPHLFNTALLALHVPSVEMLDTDAAKSLISPPPEGESGVASNTRAGSEPTKSRSHSFASPSKPPSSSSSRRKRNRPLSRVSEDEPSDGGVPGPSAQRRKPRKQRRPSTPEPSDETSATPEPGPSNAKLVESPHVRNPNADYIPPLPSYTRENVSHRARTPTPGPVYEPPAERFTPPRQIIATPSPTRMSKSSKRKSLRLTIKKEPPDIDLSKPAPPPSPTDDPLLLRGRDGRLRKASSAPPAPVFSRDTPVMDSSPDRFTDVPKTLAFSPQRDPSDHSPMPPPPSAFDFASIDHTADNAAGWSDADDVRGSEQEGEYTGRFRYLTIPTKLDPPTSRTRERQESWGKPISPHPHKLATCVAPDSAEGDADHHDVPHIDDTQEPVVLEQAQPDESMFDDEDMEIDDDVIPQTYPINEAQDEEDPAEDPLPSENEAEERGAPTGWRQRHELSVVHSPTPPPAVRESSSPIYVSPVKFRPPTPPRPAPGRGLSSNFTPAVFDFSAIPDDWSPDQAVEDDNEEIAGSSNTSKDDEPSREHDISREKVSDQVVFPVTRAVEVTPQLGPAHVSPRKSIRQPLVTAERSDASTSQLTVARDIAPHPTVADIPAENSVDGGENIDDEDGHDSDDSSDPGDESVIKIVSDNPWQAARAAAILKQHNYDLIADIKPKRRLNLDALFRKSNLSKISGITKTSPRHRRGLVIDGRVIVPGSPIKTRSELLEEVESEVGTPAPKSFADYRTPSPSQRRRELTPVGDTRIVIDTKGPRLWGKADWKLLDACITDERLLVAEHWGDDTGTMADSDAVELENVVDRFIDFMGGLDVILALGPTWGRDDILHRARALLKKHRSGSAAPPTPTGAARIRSRSTTPIVPDFTPVINSRYSGAGGSHPKIPAPAFSAETLKLPSVLGAPRYSHLLDEARAIGHGPVRGLSKIHPPKLVDAQGDNADEDTIEQSILVESESQHIVDEAQTLPNGNPAHTVNGGKVNPPPSPSIRARMKGFLFSYLSSSKSNAAKSKPHTDDSFALPPPPSDLADRPRAPISTPVSKLPPPPPHPKDLVELQHAPTPPSRLPRRLDPKRLVELRHVEPEPTPPPEPRPRRSSGASVKELVRAFEEQDRVNESEREAAQLRKVKSSELRVGKLPRPAWKP